jgi:hypothetical protein
MEVDFMPFLHALQQLRKRGRKLAARRKAAQTVVARAQ